MKPSVRSTLRGVSLITAAMMSVSTQLPEDIGEEFPPEFALPKKDFLIRVAAFLGDDFTEFCRQELKDLADEAVLYASELVDVVRSACAHCGMLFDGILDESPCCGIHYVHARFGRLA